MGEEHPPYQGAHEEVAIAKSDEAGASIPSSEPEPHRWLGILTTLVVGTLGYNVVEVGLALWSGLQAGSITLVGFGFDNVIETIAAVSCCGGSGEGGARRTRGD